MGELHLQIAVETLKEDFNVEAVIGAPHVAYRAAASQRVEVDHPLRKQSGGPGASGAGLPGVRAVGGR